MRESQPVRLAPGQSRPLAFDMVVSNALSTEISLMITYHLEHSFPVIPSPLIRYSFQARKQGEPQKITYLHSSGIVSYAILRPPSKKALDHIGSRTTLPVVLSLHGAGVKADSNQVRHSFDDSPDLQGWLLFPSGVTPWSGDDWRECIRLGFEQQQSVAEACIDRWGFADIEAAVAAIPDWIQTMDWHGPCVNTSRWLVTGHSNGGRQPPRHPLLRVI